MTTGNTTLLGLALPVEGELDGTWGDVVNDSITSLVDSAVAGTTTLSADADVTLTDTTLSANQARQAVLLWTASNGASTRNVTAPARSKPYIVINAGTGSIVLRGAGPTAGVTIISGERCLAAWNGSDFVKVASSIVAASGLTGVVAPANGGTGVANGANNTITFTGNFTFGVTLSNNTTVTFPVTGTLATLAGTETLTNKTLTTPSINNSATVGGSFKLLEASNNGTNFVALKAPDALAADVTYTLPTADGTNGQVLATNGSGALSWSSASGSSQWTTSGSDIYYTTGKVGVGVSSFTSGGGALEISNGITFPATQSASSNANTLDDYEEGTFTPTSNISFASATGTYTKIGRVVQIGIALTWPTTSDVNQVIISGLPFTCANNDPSRCGVSVAYSEYTTVVTAMVNKNTTNLILYKWSGNQPTNSELSAKPLFLGGTYLV
jgi:hypothetical protein